MFGRCPILHPPSAGALQGKETGFYHTGTKATEGKKKKARADGAVFAFVQTVLFSTIHKPPL